MESSDDAVLWFVLGGLAIISALVAGVFLSAIRKAKNKLAESTQRARAGNVQEQLRLAKFHATGTDPEFGDGHRNPSEALSWFERAAEQGHAEAQVALAVAYKKGLNVKKNASEAVNWWRRAAEQGHAEAQFCLADAISRGEGIEQNKKLAAYWWRKSAESGFVASQYNLGTALASGVGCEKNTVEALHWLMKAAKAGDHEAQFNVGYLHETGDGIPQDFQEAFRWYEKASGQNDADAQLALAKMFLDGRGTIRDYEQARKLLLLAAENGNSRAFYNLGLAYSISTSAFVDPVEAHAWFNLASATGQVEAGPQLQILEAVMKQGQLVEATKLARARFDKFKSRSRGGEGANTRDQYQT